MPPHANCSQAIRLGRVVPAPGAPWWQRRPQPFALSASEQRLHALCIGQSGSGKTALLKAVALQRLNARQAVGVLEPHRDLSEELLAALVHFGFFSHPQAFERLVYLDWAAGYVPFNILRAGTGADPYAIASNALEGFTRAFPETARAPMFTTLFLSSVLVLIENDLTITFLHQLLSQDGFRQGCLARMTDPLVLETFGHYNGLSAGGQAAAAGSLLRRSFQMSFSKTLRLTLGQPECRLDFRRLMDRGQSVILNLGTVRDQPSRALLGNLLMQQIEQAALSRAELPLERRTPFLLLVDEWPAFAPHEATLGTILEQTRKYGLTIWLAGQSLAQVGSERLAAAFENCRLQLCFSLGPGSAELAARQLGGVEAAEKAGVSPTQQRQQVLSELLNLPTRHAFVKLPHRPAVRIETLAVPELEPDLDELDAVRAAYRARYQRTEAEAEAAIASIPMPHRSGAAAVPAAFTTIFDEE